MKHGGIIALLFAIFLVVAVSAMGADLNDAERDAYLKKIEANYQTAVALKEKGDYEASLTILNRLVEDSQGLPKYEIARLDTIVEQARDLKEAGNEAWKTGMKETGMRIKIMYNANSANADYWLVYAKYSLLLEANKETHITKSIKKSFYYKPNNPEAQILEADYQLYKAKDADNDTPYGMVHGVGTGSVTERFSRGQVAKAAYETALAGKLSDARRAYVHFKLGNIENQIFKNREGAIQNWNKAVQLAADSRVGQSAKQRLQSAE